MTTRFSRLVLIPTLLMLAPAAFAGCDEERRASGQEVAGTLLGAALGGLVGAQIGHGTGNKVAIAAGVLAGGYVGNRIGAKLSCKDREYHYDATQSTLEYKPTGSSASWVNPDNGHSGSIEPTRTYVKANGTPCRDFTQTLTVDGEQQTINSTACRKPNGTWQIVKS